MKEYISEREGQLDFFETYNINFENNDEENVLKDSTDGIYHGCILEFKLNINDVNKVLLQAIKYLSKERIKGHNVPGTIFLVDLNKNKVYEFKSKEYFNEIHKLYGGPASKSNEGFVAKSPVFTFYLDKPEDQAKFIQHLQKDEFLKIDIDENCIVGWTERYYKENPTATKDDFLKEDGELRKPNKFKEYINPYKGESNEKFKYIMDKLNDKLKKKKLGAFYTPIPYCEKAAELVREAIKRVPEGNDYVIIDRCAGTGNLESVLTDEELSHCILSTYEYYEWLVLRERLEDKVKMILPENKENITFENGLIKENDAMSEEFVNNPYIKQFIDNPKCTIIMLENPPYNETQTTGQNATQSFILSEMKKSIKGKETNEIANQFIWSGFKFYLKNKESEYILFSPIKYWKATDKIVNKECNKCYILNRRYFHATPASIMIILWSNKDANITKIPNCEIFDIENNQNVSLNKKVTINRCIKTLADLIHKDKEKYNDTSFLSCNSEGYPMVGNTQTKSDPKIIGFLAIPTFNSLFNNFILMRLPYTGKHSGGVYLTQNNYLNKLPGACAKLFYANSSNWWDDMYYNTSDAGTKFESDQTFLKSCLIYTCLCQFNKCLSFKGSDGRDYYNELCFDSFSSHKSQALTDLTNFKLNADDRSIIKLFKKASQTKNYNKNYSYGLYQIIQELNTFIKDDKGKTVYDYPDLNGDINSLKVKLKSYYKKYIEPKCFKYELLK